MNYNYMLEAGVVFIILQLSICMIILLLFKKRKVECTRTEKELLKQLSEKTDFFSNMTHELKTPLSVILGAIQLIELKKDKQNKEDPCLSKNIRIIKCNCYRMLRITNNLLDLTKLEAGYLKLQPVNCNLSLLLEEIVQSVTPYAEQNQLNLYCKKSAEAIYNAVDIEKLERILLNLLSNAIKFTKPGGTVCVSNYRVGNRISISVKDSGSGIPLEKQEEVFARFSQLSTSPSIENKGSGIGLSLVKSFVFLHQGDIKIVSKPGQGCEFIINLPIRQVCSNADELSCESYSARIADAAKIELSTLHSTFS